MRFPPSFLDEIRNRLPISDVVGSRVTWDKRKTNASRGDYWACCPFHGEKSPSFHAENRKGRYHCFGCGVSGDHF
ncbi:MAG TPA: CHC2 zinc finger domain-containing protein, partial [Rhizobiaceae bacterium]|nr:CHC2 zinc finger domain-containing protein [Rhizobiaceae bacterium]